MNTTKKHSDNSKNACNNPFIKAMEDKKKIAAAVQNGINLSTLKGIKFVKPI
jgi:hypothetical protein